MRSASPTERDYPNAEIVMHENEPVYWIDAQDGRQGNQAAASEHDHNSRWTQLSLFSSMQNQRGRSLPCKAAQDGRSQ